MTEEFDRNKPGSSDQNPSKVSWIYKLSKDELKEVLTDQALPTEGTVDELRKRLSSHLKGIKGEQPKTPTDEGTMHANTPTLSGIELLDRVRKWNTHFDGTGDAIGFMERIDELSSSYGIAKDRLLNALPELFRGKALLWHRNNRGSWHTWEDFVGQFQVFFYPPGHQRLLVEQIMARRQKEGETGKTYITEMQTLMRRYARMPESEQLEQMYQNLRTDYKFYIRRNDFSTLAELLVKCDEYEALRREEKGRMRDRNIRVSSQGTHLAAIEGYNRSTCCWKCGQPGHNRFNCRRSAVLFCSFCRKEGVCTKDCRCRKENAVKGPDKRPDEPVKREVSNRMKQPIDKPRDNGEEDNRIFLPVELPWTRVRALIDTGSMNSYISERVQKICQKNGQPSKPGLTRSARLANGLEVKVKSVTELTVKINNRKVNHCFLTIPQLKEDMIVGMDILRKADMRIIIFGKETEPPATECQSEDICVISPNLRNPDRGEIKPNWKEQTVCIQNCRPPEYSDRNDRARNTMRLGSISRTEAKTGRNPSGITSQCATTMESAAQRLRKISLEPQPVRPPVSTDPTVRKWPKMGRPPISRRGPDRRPPTSRRGPDILPPFADRMTSSKVGLARSPTITSIRPRRSITDLTSLGPVPTRLTSLGPLPPTRKEAPRPCSANPASKGPAVSLNQGTSRSQGVRPTTPTGGCSRAMSTSTQTSDEPKKKKVRLTHRDRLGDGRTLRNPIQPQGKTEPRT